MNLCIQGKKSQVDGSASRQCTHYECLSASLRSGRSRPESPKVISEALIFLRWNSGKPITLPYHFLFLLRRSRTHSFQCIWRILIRNSRCFKEGFDRSPMFTGRIKGTGPRYCPSIEDKIFDLRIGSAIRYSSSRGYHTNVVYVNGFSTSLPEEIQFED